MVFYPGVVKAQLTSDCPNSNFSLGNFTDWSPCYGTFYMNYPPPPFPPWPMLAPCTNQGFAAHRHVIIPAPGTLDPYTCDSLLTVFPGEAFSARLGDTAQGGHAEQLKYNVTVSEQSYLFIYRYAVVLESPNHLYDEQPGFKVEIQDSLGQVLDSTCGYYLIYSPTCYFPPHCPRPGGWHFCYASGTAGIYWKDWTTVGMDLRFCLKI